jgi:glutaredoxin 3
MKFKIYGKANCQYCTKAVSLLTNRNIDFDYLSLGKDFDREQLLDQFPSAKTFPQIEVLTEVGVEYVGGYVELVEYLG